MAHDSLNLSCCHQCPDVNGNPVAFVCDDQGNEVLDESIEGIWKKKIADLETELAALQSKYDELKWRMDGLEK